MTDIPHGLNGSEFCKCDDCQRALKFITTALVSHILTKLLADLGYPPSWAETINSGKFQGGGLVSAHRIFACERDPLGEQT